VESIDLDNPPKDHSNDINIYDETIGHIIESKQKYEDLLHSGKIRDSKKKEAVKKMITQLDSQIDDFDNIIHAPSDDPKT